MKHRFAVRSLFLTWLAALACGSVALAGEESPLAQRVAEIRDQIAEEPSAPEALFHPAFLDAVPPAQITAILKQYHAQGGRVVRTSEVSTKGGFYGEYRFSTERGMVFPVKLGIEASSPHRINTLWFGLMQPEVDTAGEIVKKIEALPGEVSFAFWRLGGEEPQVLHASAADRPLAIGSTFKLYVLGALVQAVGEGDSAWERVVRIEDRWKSWPSGALHRWPVGSPITIHSLAAAMISVSDNTATDHLIFLQGREKIEAAQGRMGQAKPELNVPFLATREMFRIKEVGNSSERVETFLGKDRKARRAWLDGEIAALGHDAFDGIDQLNPTAIDGVEWFASASDLCRAMDWFRRATAGAKNAAAREILAINKGLEFDDEAWSYVGYKGGSEPGVVNLTWLLQRADGAWFALSAGWNDPAKTLDEKEFFALLQRFIELVAAPE